VEKTALFVHGSPQEDDVGPKTRNITMIAGVTLALSNVLAAVACVIVLASVRKNGIQARDSNRRHG
jgi:hypothetical protein